MSDISGNTTAEFSLDGTNKASAWSLSSGQSSASLVEAVGVGSPSSVEAARGGDARGVGESPVP